MTSHPNWLLANSMLETILGKNYGFDIDRIDLIEPQMWLPCVLDAMTEMDRWQQLCETLQFQPKGTLVIVDDSSLSGHGPFFTRLEDLAEFFESHIEVTDDCVLSSGDLFVIAPEAKSVMLYHHSELAILLPIIR